MALKHFIAIGSLALLFSGCTTLRHAKSKLVQSRRAGAHRGDVQPPPVPPQAQQAPLMASNVTVPGAVPPTPSATAGVPAAVGAGAGIVMPASEMCQPVKGAGAGMPVTSPSNRYLVTKFMRPCVTRTGEAGLERHSIWLAMGFPCSGGEGRVDWKGSNYQRPKLVEFILANDCPMGPADQQALKNLAALELGIPVESTVGAYTPFMVQFWEIPALKEADVGFSVELRDNEGLVNQWPRMIKGEGLRVVLVGRENAWTQTDQLYQVEADILITTKNRFQIKPVSVKVMTAKDIETAKARCEALRPVRNCASVFQL